MNKIIFKAFGIFINLTALVAPKWNAKHSFKMLIKVKRAAISEKGRVFFNKAEQHFFEIDGQSSVLHRWGNGSKKVLFLHGWKSNSQRWMPYYDKLDMSQHTMYALDAPGHGMSNSDYLNLEMYRQSIVEVLRVIGEVDTVVCHSFSNTALTYALLVRPELPIKKSVVMGAPSGVDAIFDYFIEVLGLSKRAIKIIESKINSILKIPHAEIRIEKLFNRTKQSLLVIHDKDDAITPYKPIKIALENKSKIETLITTGLQHDLKSEAVYERVIAFVNK